MKHIEKKESLVMLALLAALFLFTGCMTATAGPKPQSACINPTDLNKVIASEASLEEFSCEMKKWKGAETLHLKVAVKNTSQKERRYKVNIFLENGKAVGGLLPRKTKNGLVKPGQTISFLYPVKGMTGSPGKVDLFVKTMAQ